MALSLTPDFWSREIRVADERTKEQLRIMESQIARYHTPFWRGQGAPASGTWDPENHAYEYITGTVPKMVIRNPRVRTDSSKAGLGGWIAIMYKHLLNKRVREVRFDEILNQLAHDALFHAAIAMVIPQEDYRYGIKGGYARNPSVVRISQEDFLIDPMALSRDTARWMGHKWRIDRDDLLAKAKEEVGWDVEAIRKLPVDIDSPDRNNLERNEVECVDVHIPNMVVDDDAGPEDGFNGTILTFAWTYSGAGEIIRKPSPTLCPPGGRYRFCDINYVPNSPFGLSPLIATEGQSRELNALTRRAIESNMRYARLLLVEDGDAGFNQRLKEAEHDLVLAVRSLENNKVQSVERGGVTEQMVAQIQMARDRLDRNASRSDSQRGMVNARATATAEHIANAASDVRTENIKARFHEFARQLVNDMAFFYWYDEDTRSFLGGDFLSEIGFPKDDIEASGIAGFPYEGGDVNFEAYKDVSFYDLNIMFEPMSMEHTDSNVAQKRAMDAVGMTLQISQLAALRPDHDWSMLANLIGDAINVPDFANIAGVSRPMPIPAGAGIPQQFTTGAGGRSTQEGDPAGELSAELGAMAKEMR